MKIMCYGDLIEAELIAHGGEWDYYADKEIVYYIAKPNSGMNSGIYCGVSDLSKHFYRLRQVRKYETLIPEDWQIVNEKFFENLGIR